MDAPFDSLFINDDGSSPNQTCSLDPAAANDSVFEACPAGSGGETIEIVVGGKKYVITPALWLENASNSLISSLLTSDQPATAFCFASRDSELFKHVVAYIEQSRLPTLEDGVAFLKQQRAEGQEEEKVDAVGKEATKEEKAKWAKRQRRREVHQIKEAEMFSPEVKALERWLLAVRTEFDYFGIESWTGREESYYLVGGCQGEIYTRNVRRFDALTRQWSLVSPLSEEQGEKAVFSIGSHVYCVMRDGHLEKYHPIHDIWTREADGPGGLSKGASLGCMLQRDIYTINYMAPSPTMLPLLHRYNTQSKTWTFISKLPVALKEICEGGQFVGCAGTLYLVGGYGDERLFKYNLDREKELLVGGGPGNSSVTAESLWTAIAFPSNMIEKGSSAVVCVLDRYLFIAGGYSHDVYWTRYDTLRNAWATVDQMRLSCCSKGVAPLTVDGVLTLVAVGSRHGDGVELKTASSECLVMDHPGERRRKKHPRERGKKEREEKEEQKEEEEDYNPIYTLPRWTWKRNPIPAPTQDGCHLYLRSFLCTSLRRKVSLFEPLERAIFDIVLAPLRTERSSTVEAIEREAAAAAWNNN